MSDLTTFSEDSNTYLNVPENLVYVNTSIAKEVRASGSSDTSIYVLSLSMVQASIHLKQGAFREAISAILDSFKFITQDDIETALESYQYLWLGLSPIMDFVKNCDDGCLFDTISVDVIGLIEPFLAIREYLGCALILGDGSDISYCALPYSSGDSGQLYDPDVVYAVNLMCSADSDVSAIDADILQSLSDSASSQYTTLSGSLGDQDYSVLATFYASTALADLISDDLDSSILNMQSAIASASLITAGNDNFHTVDETIYDAYTEIYFAFADLDDYSDESDAFISLSLNFNFYLYQYALKVNDNTPDWTTVSDLQTLISTSLEDADTSKTVILNGLTSCLDSLADDDFTTALSFYEGTISDIAFLSGVNELYDYMTKTYVMLLISLLPYDSGSTSETNLGDLIDAYNGYIAALYAIEKDEEETSARALSTESTYDADLVAQTLTAVNEYLSSQFSEGSRSLGSAADYIIDSYNEVRAQYEDSFALNLLAKSVSLFQSSLTDRALRYFSTALKSASDTSKLKSPFYSAAMTAASVVIEGANELSNAMDMCDLISDAVDELIDLMDEYAESDSSSETDDDDDDDEEKTYTCDGCSDDSTTYITFTSDDQEFVYHDEDDLSGAGTGATDTSRALTTTEAPAGGAEDPADLEGACDVDISAVMIATTRDRIKDKYTTISSGQFVSYDIMRIFDLFYSVLDSMELVNYDSAVTQLIEAMAYMCNVKFESTGLRQAIYVLGFVSRRLMGAISTSEIDNSTALLQKFRILYTSYFQVLDDRTLEAEGDVKARIFDSVSLFSADIAMLDISDDDGNVFVGVLEKFGVDMASEEYEDAVANLSTMISTFSALASEQRFVLNPYMKRAIGIGKGMLFLDDLDPSIALAYSNLLCPYKGLVVANVADETASAVVEEVISAALKFIAETTIGEGTLSEMTPEVFYSSMRAELILQIAWFNEGTTNSRALYSYLYLFIGIRNFLCGYYTNGLKCYYTVIKLAQQFSYQGGSNREVISALGQFRGILLSILFNKGIRSQYMDELNPAEEAHISLRQSFILLPQEPADGEVSDFLLTTPLVVPFTLADIDDLLYEAYEFIDPLNTDSMVNEVSTIRAAISRAQTSVGKLQSSDIAGAISSLSSSLSQLLEVDTKKSGKSSYFWWTAERLLPVCILCGIEASLAVNSVDTYLSNYSSAVKRYLQAILDRFNRGEVEATQFIPEDVAIIPELPDQEYIDTLTTLIFQVDFYKNTAKTLGSTSEILDAFTYLSMATNAMSRRDYGRAIGLLSKVLGKVDEESVTLSNFDELWSAIVLVYERLSLMNEVGAFPDTFKVEYWADTHYPYDEMQFGTPTLSVRKVNSYVMKALEEKYKEVKDSYGL